MPKKSVKKKKKRSKSSKHRAHSQFSKQRSIIMEYYIRPFLYLHEEMARHATLDEAPHPIRRRFWSLVLPNTYDSSKGAELVNQYASEVQREMAAHFRRHSMAYWIHAYRRLSPMPIGENTEPATVLHVRAAFEAAIQKHASIIPQDDIAMSGTTPIQEVLSGLLMNPEFEIERNNLQNSPPQLVLLKFDVGDLRELYVVEELAYEIWRSAALLRILGKGAPLIVSRSGNYATDGRTVELHRLVTNFDKRLMNAHERSAASTGAVFDSHQSGDLSGILPLPQYNVLRDAAPHLRQIAKAISGHELSFAGEPNFVWSYFDMRGFYLTHLPLAAAFRDKFGVSLEAVLTVVICLCFRMVAFWSDKKDPKIVRYWQRAYDGPFPPGSLLDEVKAHLVNASKVLTIDASVIKEEELLAAIKFWTLEQEKQDDIDLLVSGPHEMVIPVVNDQMIVDLAWTYWRLNRLFHGVWISDQNYKGEALEKALRNKGSVLPHGECRSADGTAVQIDGAFAIGKHLVIVECKAVGWALGCERGDPTSIRYRNDKVVGRILREVDDKAAWLARHPIGTNYDISGFADIIPIGISPFVEYIPSIAPYFWVFQDLPRVMTLEELRHCLEKGMFSSDVSNAVPISGFKAGATTVL